MNDGHSFKHVKGKESKYERIMKLVEKRKKNKKRQREVIIKKVKKREIQNVIYDSFEDLRNNKKKDVEKRIDEEMKQMQKEHTERTMKLRQLFHK